MQRILHAYEFVNGQCCPSAADESAAIIPIGICLRLTRVPVIQSSCIPAVAAARICSIMPRCWIWHVWMTKGLFRARESGSRYRTTWRGTEERKSIKMASLTIHSFAEQMDDSLGHKLNWMILDPFFFIMYHHDNAAWSIRVTVVGTATTVSLGIRTSITS